MARLALEDPIEFLDGLVELLATVQLVGEQKVIENTVKRSHPGRLLRTGCLHPVAELTQVASSSQVQGAGGCTEPLCLVEEAQGAPQISLRLIRLSVGCGLGLGLGKDQQELIAIGKDLRLLGRVEVVIESGPTIGICQDAIDGQRSPDGGARGFEVRGQIHPRIQSTQELGLIALLDELPVPGLRRPPIGLGTQFALDPAEQRLSRCPQTFQSGLAAERRQDLFEVERGPCASHRRPPRPGRCRTAFAPSCSTSER